MYTRINPRFATVLQPESGCVRQRAEQGVGDEESEKDGEEKKEAEIRFFGKFPEGYPVGMGPCPESDGHSPCRRLRPSAGAGR